MNGIAARHLADLGYPVFTCEPFGKKPLTKHGYLDATSDPGKVALWWVRWPTANIGFPTGRIVVLDEDRDGSESLDGLERDAGRLPQTFAVATGGGGRHLYFEDKECMVRCSAGRLGRGLDVRGAGGYVLLPPSRTKDVYRTLDTHPIVPLPEWLRELLADPNLPGEPSPGAVVLDPIGPPIYRGSRNATLASIAGSLRAHGHGRDEIERHLHEVNAARCRPMLPLREVERIAGSIARYPAGRARPAASPEVRVALERIEAAVLASRWPGMGGATDRAVVTALVSLGWSYATMIPGGVRVSVSRRDLALLTGVRHAIVTVAVKRLRRSGWITTDNRDRRRNEAGAFVLRLPQDLTQGRTTLLRVSNGWLYGTELSQTPALRWGAGRLGKKAAQVIEALLRAGGAATLQELAETTTTRKNNLKRRQVARLQDAGIVTLEDDTVRHLEGWRDRLDREREITGELESERADRVRYEREMFNQRLREEKCDPDRSAKATREERAMGRRGNNEGSTRQRKDGRWEGRYTLHTSEGPKQRTVYGKTRKDAAEKLTKAMSDRDGGLVYDAGKTTVAEYLTGWLADSVRDTVRQRTYERYESLVRAISSRRSDGSSSRASHRRTCAACIARSCIAVKRPGRFCIFTGLSVRLSSRPWTTVSSRATRRPPFARHSRVERRYNRSPANRSARSSRPSPATGWKLYTCWL